MKKVVLIVAIFLLASLGIFMLHKQKTKTIVIAFAGDTMLGRMVNKAIDQKGYAYPLGSMIPFLQKTNLNIINFEATLTNSTQKVPKVFNFKALPDRVQTLKLGRINVVSLANNHSKDFGNEGMFETVATLDAAGIQHVGAGKNLSEARKPVIVERQGIKIGILGYTDNEPTWKATETEPGIHHIQVGDIKTVLQDIAQIRDKVDILIATLHWGPNMRQRPTQSFIDFAHKMVDAGIDIIHGHSAHIFQGVELYRNKLILYDTGDFVDDYRVTKKLRNDLSFLFLVTVDKTGPKKLELIPTAISNMQVNTTQGDDKAWSLQQMQKLSAELGTTIGDDGILIIE